MASATTAILVHDERLCTKMAAVKGACKHSALIFYTLIDFQTRRMYTDSIVKLKMFMS